MITMVQPFPKTGIGLEGETLIQQISHSRYSWYKVGLLAEVHFIERRPVSFPRKGKWKWTITERIYYKKEKDI